MVKDVHQHDDIVRAISERQDPTIELADWDRRVRPRANLDARRSQPGTVLCDRSSERSISAAHIEQSGCAIGDHLGDIVGERPNTASEDQPAVKGARDSWENSAEHGPCSCGEGGPSMTHPVNDLQRVAPGPGQARINVHD